MRNRSSHDGSQRITPQEFVAKWRQSSLKETSASQEHFIDLCRLIGHPTPAEADPEGTWFCFERGASKTAGGEGWADVWKKGFFAWEYKGKHKDLEAAYRQLLQYRTALLNPPLLIVSDMETILIRTDFTNTVRREFRLSLDDLLEPAGLETLRHAFENPDRLRAEQTSEQVTREVATQFSKLADALRLRGVDPHAAAHFLIRVLFCLFAEDVGLLPNQLFRRLVENARDDPASFEVQVGQLFAAMRTGGWFGIDRIPNVNGGLFDESPALHLEKPDLEILAKATQLDWSAIEPSIFGTLFERSLDPGKRAQLGAHYTSREDILLIVEPVLMAPLRRRWQEVKEKALALSEKHGSTKSGLVHTRLRTDLSKLLTGFADEIALTTVLDPACGSGNFLYVALRELLSLEKEVITLSADLGVGGFFPSVSPSQLFGIEVNEYAHELAQATIWIGYIQWLRENGFGYPKEPILRRLDNIHEMDAILAFDDAGNPIEPEWPEATVVVGNPPFLHGSKLRAELGDRYVESLFSLYEERVSGFADLCCYWFERSRAEIERGRVERAGLLATQGIRGGASREVLKRIKTSGDIFFAQSDRPWILDGANVHISMIGFDNGSQQERRLDGATVATINPNLSKGVDTTTALALPEVAGLWCYGSQQKGQFNVRPDMAEAMLSAPNPNGRPSSDVLKVSLNGARLMRRTGETWVIDFGRAKEEAAASGYEAAFEHVRAVVLPLRENHRETIQRKYWWLHARPSPGYRSILAALCRYIVTPAVSKHRVFIWAGADLLVDHNTIVFGREDDYFFGVLHSKVHELWARRQGTQLREAESGFRYTPTTCFETFPLPWPPGKEPQDDPRVQAITAAAKDLVEKRDLWLNPPGWTKTRLLEFPATVGGLWTRFINPSTVVRRGGSNVDTARYPRIVPRDEDCAKKLAKRTLTSLYNERPTWLDLAHRQLDDAVLDAYAWPHDLADEQVLERLLALNLERARGRSNSKPDLRAGGALMPDEARTLILFCPTCNMQVEARVVAVEAEATPVQPAALGDICDVPHDVVAVSFAVCRRCRQPFLLEERFYEIPGEVSAPQGEAVLYPAERSFDQEGVPEPVARAYHDATRAFAVGLYEPCVIMCRKALEGIVTGLGATHGTLNQRLAELQMNHRIDDKLAEWADGLRLVGNDAAHDPEVRLGKEDARDSLDFLEALLSYTFTLTRRFELFRARRAQSRHT